MTNHHRPLQLQKLIDVGFIPHPAPVGRHTNAVGAVAAAQRAVQRLVKLHALPSTPSLHLRPMQESDVSAMERKYGCLRHEWYVVNWGAWLTLTCDSSV